MTDLFDTSALDWVSIVHSDPNSVTLATPDGYFRWNGQAWERPPLPTAAHLEWWAAGNKGEPPQTPPPG